MAETLLVSEEEAEGQVKAIFQDIRATMQLGTVGPLFRRLGVYPWYLDLAWRCLKPNAQTVYFQESARRLADYAAASPVTVGRHPGSSVSEIHTLLRPDSMLLAAGAALHMGSRGQLPKLHAIPPEQTRAVSPTPGFDGRLISPEPNPRHQAALDVIRDNAPWLVETAGMTALLSTQSDLFGAWALITPRLAGEAFAAAVGNLTRQAEVAAEDLPFRMEISATACRQAGVSESQIDAIQTLIRQSVLNLGRGLLGLAALLSVVGQSIPTTSASAAG